MCAIHNLKRTVFFWGGGSAAIKQLLFVIWAPLCHFPSRLCLFAAVFDDVHLCSCWPWLGGVCRDKLSRCLKSLYSSRFLLSEFDWIIQGFNFARAEIFIAVGPCLQHYTVTTSSLKSLQQTNQLWGRGEGDRKTTVHGIVVFSRLRRDGTLRPAMLMCSLRCCSSWHLFVCWTPRKENAKKSGSLWGDIKAWGNQNSCHHKMEVSPSAFGEDKKGGQTWLHSLIHAG